MLARLAEYYGVFQFTPLREGRPRLLLRMSCWHYFNSRPSARGDANPPLHRRRTHYFNSRPSARGDQVKSCIGRREKRFQFTPLREGRRLPLQNGVIVFEISIHAPPRGATLQIFRMRPPLAFQFTPLREGRRCPSAVRSHHLHFNSRPSARGDGKANQVCCRLAISIHAPPRGATQSACLPCLFSADFNSRPSARGDLRRVLVECPRLISIHAPPRGATPGRARVS